VPNDPNTLSLVNGEWNCVMCVGHVTGEEKYECVMLNVLVRESRSSCGKVCCGPWCGFFFCFVFISLIEPYYFGFEWLRDGYKSVCAVAGFVVLFPQPFYSSGWDGKKVFTGIVIYVG
jgi:hypothetical protein